MALIYVENRNVLDGKIPYIEIPVHRLSKKPVVITEPQNFC